MTGIKKLSRQPNTFLRVQLFASLLLSYIRIYKELQEMYMLGRHLANLEEMLEPTAIFN